MIARRKRSGFNPLLQIWGRLGITTEDQQHPRTAPCETGDHKKPTAHTSGEPFGANIHWESYTGVSNCTEMVCEGFMVKVYIFA